MTYDITYTFSVNSFAGRKVSDTVLKFASGVKKIKEANIRTCNPYIVNSVENIKIWRPH